MFRWALVPLLTLFFSSGLVAQTRPPDAQWPDRPIRVIVPFQPGGIADVIMRIVGQKLSNRLGQQIVVDNRVGGGGKAGAESVARAEPDGYTLGFANTSTHAIAPSMTENLSFDPIKDFAPVAMIGSSPFVLAINPALPIKNVQEFVDAAKAKPRSMSFASAGTGTLAHLAGVLFERLAKVQMIHVPYRGTNQAMVDLMEGRIDSQFGTIPPTLQYIKTGKMRALAVTGDKRSHVLPDVPTVAEAGVPGYELTLWQAIVAPVAVSPAIVARLNSEIVKILNEPDTIEKLDQLGVDSEPGIPDVLGRRIISDISKWREVVKDVKVAP